MQQTYTKSELREFLSNYPLFKPYSIGKFSRGAEAYADPAFLIEERFLHYCTNEHREAHFLLDMPQPQASYWKTQEEDVINPLVLNTNNCIDYVMHYRGKCISCQKHSVDFLLHIWSISALPSEYGNSLLYDEQTKKHIYSEIEPEIEVFIEKVGIYPNDNFFIDTKVEQFLYPESRELYRNAQKCLHESLGQGAYCYLSHVVERELLLLANDMAGINAVYEELIYDQIEKFKEKRDFHYIATILMQNLPKALHGLNANFFIEMYDLISLTPGTISDDEALEVSKTIHLNLKFMIYLLFEEKHPVVAFRELR